MFRNHKPNEIDPGEYQLKNASPLIPVSIILALMFALSAGCASKDAAVLKSNEPRQIVDIVIEEYPGSLILAIRGNQNLIYKEDKQLDSPNIILVFPDTSIEGVRGRFFPPDNEIIRSIIAGEDVENETTHATVYIYLKSVWPYSITTRNAELQVIFNKNPVLPQKTTPQPEPANTKPEPQLVKPVQKSAPVATALRSVTAETFENSVAVNVEANGTIKNYKAFTMVNPDRIVFDIYNIKSPHRKEQKIFVRSKWTNRIRYYGHPDKLRLVIDTHNKSFPNYSSVPAANGLIIHVGSND